MKGMLFLSARGRLLPRPRVVVVRKYVPLRAVSRRHARHEDGLFDPRLHTFRDAVLAQRSSLPLRALEGIREPPRKICRAALVAIRRAKKPPPPRQAGDPSLRFGAPVARTPCSVRLRDREHEDVRRRPLCQFPVSGSAGRRGSEDRKLLLDGLLRILRALTRRRA